MQDRTVPVLEGAWADPSVHTRKNRTSSRASKSQEQTAHSGFQSNRSLPTLHAWVWTRSFPAIHACLCMHDSPRSALQNHRILSTSNLRPWALSDITSASASNRSGGTAAPPPLRRRERLLHPNYVRPVTGGPDGAIAGMDGTTRPSTSTHACVRRIKRSASAQMFPRYFACVKLEDVLKNCMEYVLICMIPPR